MEDIEKKKNQGKISFKALIILQVSVLFFAFSSIAGKFASKYEFLSFNFILYFGIEVFLLGVYALIWQQVIKKVDISIAYANKATSIFWSMLLAFLVFKEQITLKCLIGVVLIFIGIMVVNKDE